MVNEEFLCVYVCVHMGELGRGSYMRSCSDLQECTLIYGADIASARCLEMEPLTFRPAECKIMPPPTTHTHTHTHAQMYKHTHYLLLCPPTPFLLSPTLFPLWNSNVKWTKVWQDGFSCRKNTHFNTWEVEGKAERRRAGAGWTVGGEQGGKEERMFRILRN